MHHLIWLLAVEISLLGLVSIAEQFALYKERTIRVQENLYRIYQ